MTPARMRAPSRRGHRMDAGTPRLWRRRTVAAVGAIGIALAAGGTLFFPGVASADSSIAPQHWDVTGADVTDWKVPDFTCGIDWTLQGGSGGAGVSNNVEVGGGRGGKVEAHMTVDPGQSFVIRVGGQGGDAANEGANGGKSGAQPSGGNAADEGGAGGGATVVLSDSEPVLVAGGGGGGGGGAGGGARGGNAGLKGTDLRSSVPGGAAGDTSGSDAADMVGRNGTASAGAGGGGYYGGGAGTAVDVDGAMTGSGGGGGRSYAANGLTNVTNGTASARGEGSVDAAFPPCLPDTPVITSAVTNSNGGADVVF